MPKKGENSKAVEAKARKTAARNAEEDRKQKEIDDAYWADDDKHIAKKQNRKDDREKKRLETVQRKTANKLLVEEEAASIVPKSSQPAAKITQAQIAAERERREAAAKKTAVAEDKAKVKEAPLVENLNRELRVDEEAKTIDEALKMLTTSDKEEADRNPERRVKAAYKAFEDVRLPQLKAENPSLRLSQLKQILFNEWQKSPDNPLVKARAAGDPDDD